MLELYREQICKSALGVFFCTLKYFLTGHMPYLEKHEGEKQYENSRRHLCAGEDIHG